MNSRIVWILALASLLWASCQTALAADIVWDGDVSNDATDGGNWVGDAAPGPGDAAVFRNGASLNSTPDLGTNNVTWNQLVFNSGGATTLNGSGTITLNQGRGQCGFFRRRPSNIDS